MVSGSSAPVALTNYEVYGSHPGQRNLVFSLARDLNVSVETISSLAEECEDTVLVHGSVGREIITKSNRDSICRDLQAEATNGLVSKDEFAQKHGLGQSGLDLLVNGSDLQMLEVNGYFYSSSYGLTVSRAVADILREHIHNLQ